MIHINYSVYMLLYGRRMLTEGHGSCSLSVWTLAEPLGVLFQARSDNLAPMTRLATAQFTGRSSTHAQQPPPPTTTSLPPVFPSSPICSPCTLLHLSTLPSLFSQLLSISSFMLCFFTTLLRSLLSISITLLSTRQKLSAGILERQNLQTCQSRLNLFKYTNTLTSLSSLRNKFLLWIVKSLTHKCLLVSQTKTVMLT